MIDVWLLGYSDRNVGLPVQNEIRDLMYGSAILGVFWLALHPFRQKQAWIGGNSHRSRHSTGTVCFVVCIIVCMASLKEKEKTTLGLWCASYPYVP